MGDTGGDSAETLLIHIMVLKCLAVCNLTKYIYYRWSVMIALEGSFLKKKNNVYMI